MEMMNAYHTGNVCCHCCEICGQELETEALVQLHMKEEHERYGAQCPFCDLNQVGIDEINLHVNTAHAHLLSPLRSEDHEESYQRADQNKNTDNPHHLLEVPPRQYPVKGYQVSRELSPSREFCSPRKKEIVDEEMDDDYQEPKESLAMEVIHNSDSSLSSWCNLEMKKREQNVQVLVNETSESGSSTTEEYESPLKKIIGNLSPTRWSFSGENRNQKVLKETNGLWEGIPSTSGSIDVLGNGDDRWVIESSDDEDEMIGGKGKVVAKPKETLLNLSRQAKHIDEPILCPFCGLGDFNPEVIQQHVQAEHSEVSMEPTIVRSPKLDLVGHGGKRSSTAESPSAVTNRKLFCGPGNEGHKHSCPICHVEGLSADEMNTHVNSHFEHQTDESAERYDRLVAEQIQREEKELQEKQEKETFKLLQKQYGMDERGSYMKQTESNLEWAVVKGDIGIADFYNQKVKLQRLQTTGEEDHKYRTSGIITALARFYYNGAYNIDYARLAEQTDHFGSSPGCKGWGCGYRNLQMLFSAMWHDQHYREVVFNGKNAIPSITYIQKLIENAWKNGFDPAGMEQLGNRLVNTRKWIGATEITAILHSLRVKCKLVDFHKGTGPGGTHPRMFEWVRDYFKRSNPFHIFGKEEAALSKKMPIYLQHQGHSRTIVGCEVLKDGNIRLLLFDPSTKPNDMATIRAGDITGAALRPLRKTMGQLKHKQYQIVAVTGLITSDREYEESKLLVSVRIP